MRILIQKFGGTSVATREGRQRALDHVQQALRDGLCPVVVVSAMGRQGDPYATDTLLGLALEANPEPEPRDLDLLLACGEVIAAVVVAAALRSRGVAAAALTGAQAGIVTDDQHGDAAVLRVDPQPLLARLRRGEVPVVTGFQGATETGEITTLGRGGSDTTAAALGAALRAEAVEIYTDVDGIKTADPRIVPDARTLPVTTYDEVAQMAHHGAKVVHPRAVELAMQGNIPLRIKSTFSDAPGTLVTFSMEAAGSAVSPQRPQGVVTAVTHVQGLAQISVAIPAGDRRGRELLRRLAQAGVSIDLINISPQRQAFCIDERRLAKARSVLAELELEPAIRTGCVKVSIVGAGMRGRPGVMATVAEVLAAAGVEILQTSDSHVTISCLVRREEMEAAVQALHQGFGLARPV